MAQLCALLSDCSVTLHAPLRTPGNGFVSSEPQILCWEWWSKGTSIPLLLGKSCGSELRLANVSVAAVRSICTCRYVLNFILPQECPQMSCLNSLDSPPPWIINPLTYSKSAISLQKKGRKSSKTSISFQENIMTFS